MRTAFRNQIERSIEPGTGARTQERGSNDMLRLEVESGIPTNRQINFLRDSFLSDLWEILSQETNEIQAKGPCGANVTCVTTVRFRESGDDSFIDVVMIGTVLCEGDDRRLCSDSWRGSWEAVHEPLPLGGGKRWFSREPDGSVHWTLRDMNLVSTPIPEAIDLLADHLTAYGWQVDSRSESEIQAHGPCSEAVDCRAVIQFEEREWRPQPGGEGRRPRILPLVDATVIGTKSADYTPDRPPPFGDDE